MAVTHLEARTEAPSASTPPARKGALRRVAGFVTGLALAAGAVYAQTFALPFEQQNSFLTTKGEIGQAVATNRFSVKVTSLATAHAVDTKDFSGKVSRVQSSHVFLLVNVSATTPREPMQLSKFSPPVLVTADDRRYQPTDKVDGSLTLFNKWLQPGWWSSGVLVFEVPKDALPGATLIFIPPNKAIVDNFAPEAQIDLRLSDAAAARLISQAEDFHSLVDGA
jgi:hypothetical protein